jgi:hypothetical protein
MELNRKELELLLHSLKPAGLSERTLERLETAVTGDFAIEASLRSLESRLAAQTPCALSDDTLNRLMKTVQNVPFALNRKVLLFPGTHKEQEVATRKYSPARRLLAVAACAALGGLAALWTPISGPSAGVTSSGNLGTTPPATGLTLRDGIVATNFGTGIEAADDEGVIWTQDHQPKRVLRFQYKDRVLMRDKDGVDCMLLIPREEIYVIPEKVD